MNNTLVKLLRVYIVGDADPGIIDKWDRRIALQPEVDDFNAYLREKYCEGCLDSVYPNGLTDYENDVREWSGDPIMHFNLFLACKVWCEELEKEYLEIRDTCLKIKTDYMVNEKDEMTGRMTTFRDYFDMRRTAVDSLKKIMELEPDLSTIITASMLKEISDLSQRKWWELEISPRGSYWHFNLAQELEEQNRLDEAIKEYQLSIRLDPGYGEPYLQLGNLYYNLSKLEEAEIQYKKFIQLFPQVGLGYCVVGRLYTKWGKLEEAIKEFGSVLQLDPDNNDVHLNLEVIHRMRSQVEQAEEEFEKAKLAEADIARLYFKLAGIYEEIGDLANAVEQYQKSLGASPSYNEARNNLGFIYYRQGKFSEAIREFQAVLEKDRDYFNAHYGLASALEQIGQYRESLDHWKMHAQAFDRPDIWCKSKWKEQVIEHIKLLEIKIEA
jgi:tetratricopeptide (TPR) repeat protein